MGKTSETEVESALIAFSDDVAGLAAELEALRELNGYILVPRPQETIVDEYFDTLIAGWALDTSR